MARPYETPITSVPEAIPEAILWKRNVLFLQFQAVSNQADYYASINPAEARDTHKNYQASIIGLYSYLKVKLKKNLKKKELEEFKGIEDYINANPYDANFQFPMRYLNRCLDLLGMVIERIGITKVELDVEDLTSIMKRP